MEFRCGWYTYLARFWQTWQRINQTNHARQCLSWTRRSSLRGLWYRTSIGTSILFWNIWKFDTQETKDGQLIEITQVLAVDPGYGNLIGWFFSDQVCVARIVGCCASCDWLAPAGIRDGHRRDCLRGWAGVSGRRTP